LAFQLRTLEDVDEFQPGGVQSNSHARTFDSYVQRGATTGANTSPITAFAAMLPAFPKKGTSSGEVFGNSGFTVFELVGSAGIRKDDARGSRFRQ
jgi:hypothetical protein